MSKSMVVVESPTKAKTIEKYLGKNFFVKASAGHVKDLPRGILGVDIEGSFKPTYKILPDKKKVVSELRKAAEKADVVYLAADPDREGEAICQHLAEILNGSSHRRIYRVLFNEITEQAILAAFDNPLEINSDKVEAQQARRILDRLVGYKVSPLLWRNVRSGLSAGRVQTVALRLIVDREREIRAFVPEEYWTITALVTGDQPPPFEAKVAQLEGKKVKIPNQEKSDAILKILKESDFVVTKVQKRKRKRNPLPPFITSKLQQDASRKLNFSVKKTMVVAQRLYEGIEAGSEGQVGLITYMRTDSTRVADSALAEAREYIETAFGENYLPGKANRYRQKKGAQDAHEAIRPTSALRTPEQLKTFLGRDEYRLYELIWNRFVSSQMTPALFDQTHVAIEAGEVELRASGSILRFDGFLRVYEESPEEGKVPDEKNKRLPELKVGQVLKVEKITPEQKFTQPPPRFNEASLVKALEDRGIGRPSTYAQILSVIQVRDYVRKEEGRFVSSETGEIVTDLLVEHFQELFDYDYTAKMEENLDGIESGKENWVHALREFYRGFSEELQKARKEMRNLRREEKASGIQCDECGAEMMIKWGRFGRFLACSKYPECKNTRELADEGGKEKAPKKTLDEKCPQCESSLVVRHGRFGDFVACSSYPNCRYVKPNTTGVACPGCGKGEVVQRRSKRGKVFFGCSTYPDCDFVSWQKPVNQPCPTCGASYLVEKFTKRDGLKHVCSDRQCAYSVEVEEAVATTG